MLQVAFHKYAGRLNLCISVDFTFGTDSDKGIVGRDFREAQSTFGNLKSLAENLVSSQITPRLQIDGPFQASVGKEIHLVAEDIWLDNPDWVNEQALIRLHRLDVSLNTWSLITGQILIENIELDEVAIHLEQDGAGLNNWTLLEADPDQQQDDSGSALDLLIRQARISELAITYVDPARESPLRFNASAINQVQLESGDLQLGLTGDINGTPVTLDGTAGTFANLLAVYGHVPTCQSKIRSFGGWLGLA